MAKKDRSAKSAEGKDGKPPPGGLLVAIDFSPISRKVLDHAVELAECAGRPLIVLHVVHDPGDAPGYYRVKGRNKVLRRAEDVAKDMLDDFLAKSREEHPDSEVLRDARSILLVGLPASRILEVVKRTRPWMVVMGSTGRTGLSRFLLGSKAEQVLRLCPVPVTVVKSDAKE